MPSSRLLRTLCTVLTTLCLPACPSAIPDSGQFAAGGDAGGGLGALGGGDAGLGGLGGDSADSGDAGSGDTAAGDVVSGDAGPDAAPADTLTSDTLAADTGSLDTGSADGTPSDLPCLCASNADCAGIAVGTCQQAVCKTCACQVELAPDGSPCGGTNLCAKGQCLPAPKPGPWAVSIAAGGHHSCARHPDGSVSCWGSGSQGQLGTGGTASAQKTPKQVVALQGAEQLAAGNAHTCARHQGGKVSCWGTRFNGQIGSGDKSGSALVPEAAGTLTDALSIGVGTYGSFAVRKGATLWGWGKNNDGQLLLDNLLSQPLPVQIAPLLWVQQVCGGEMYACALLTGGQVQCWGRNTDGQVGHGEAIYSSPPLAAGPVTGLPAVTGLACGHYHVCAWDSAGKAWCWGKNLSGQLGTGSYSADPVNAAIPLDGVADVVAMACGQGQTCAARKSGELLCWGDNDQGQAGVPGSKDVYVPKLIDVGGKVKAVAAGIDHGCALREDGAVACWGNGSYGQLGDGGSLSSTVAVVVVGSAEP